MATSLATGRGAPTEVTAFDVACASAVCCATLVPTAVAAAASAAFSTNCRRVILRLIAFSSPGKIPGLIQPSAYASLVVPALIVTGTKDLVPGFVTDPTDHLFPIESAPAGAKYGLVVADGEHKLVDDAVGFARAAPAVSAFVEAYGLDDAAARTRLKAFKAAPGDRFIVRETAS